MASRYRIRRQRRGKKLRKQKESWLRRWGARVGKGALSVATVGSLTFLGFNAYRYVQHSGQLNVGEVRIMGCMNIGESELLDLAKVDFRSNLFNLDLQELSRRLAQHPWVEKAKVHRDVSGRALIIEVQERIPRALILLDDLYLMDRNGEVFKKAENKEKLDFPILTGLTLQEWKKREPQSMEVLQQALEFLDQVDGRKVFTLQEISEVNLSKKNGLTIYTTSGGVPIRLGTADYADKLNRLEKVLPDLRSKWRSVEYLALDYPKKVVVKMKESAPEKTRKS